MPASVFSTKRAIAISAPVLPALTQASARPSLTRLIATRIEELRLVRIAIAGASSLSTISSACSSSTRSGRLPFSAASMSGWRPTSKSCASA